MERALIRDLRANGFDLATPTELGRRGPSDDEQLTFATSEGRVVITCNIGDYARIHREWMDTDLLMQD